MKLLLIPGVAVLGISAFGLNTDRIAPITNPPIRQSGLDAHDCTTSGSILGQFRTNLSAWLWVRTDLYLHNGVMMRPITLSERRAGITIERSARDGKEALHPETMVTVVPSADRDFRGVFGDVDREVNAWKDMHEHHHNDPKQTLPLFRLMAWLDPQFVEAWTTGALIFARDPSPAATNNALSFLKEGLAANPRSVDILTELAYIMITRQKALPKAVPLLEEARQIGVASLPNLAGNERDALETNYRWLAMCYRDLGRPGDVVKVTDEGLRLFPDDQVIKLVHDHPNDRPRSTQK